MRCIRYIFAVLLATASLSSISSAQQQAWSEVLSNARATNWTLAGLPGDRPPDVLGSWAQCTASVPGCAGTVIPSCGSSGSGVSPSTCGITQALAACGTNHYVQLAGSAGSPADFYLTGSINMPSNCVLRGGGAAYSRMHAVSSGSYGCNGQWGMVCIIGSNSYISGNCGVWPGPSSCSLGGIAVGNTANWLSGYASGSTSITVDNISGMAVGTPIILNECDLGFSGNTSNFACGAPTTGNAGAITTATVGSGGSGYNVGDTGTIAAVGQDFGMNFGSNTATYQVTSVSGSAVTGITIVNGGFGYTYTQTSPNTPTSTSASTGSGSGLTINISGVGAYDTGSIMNCVVAMFCTSQSPANTSQPGRSQEEVVVVSAISGSSSPYTITLNHPIVHPNWTSSQGPKALWGRTVVTNTGIENVELDQSSYQGNCGHGGCMNAVGVNMATNWWVVGISSNVANYMHVNAWETSNGLIRDNYFYETANKGTQSYGVGCTSQCDAILVENNIMQGIVDAMVPSGTCTSCVFAYNFALNADNTDTAVMFSSNTMHTASTDYILEEGNIGGGINLDSTHGPHSFNTFFRNYFTGYEANEGVMPYQSTLAVIIDAYSRYNNLIGNVLGTAGYHKTFKCAPTAPLQQYCTGYSQYVQYAVYTSGWSHSDQLDYNYTPHTPNDMLTSTTMMWYGNYDVVTNGVRWCGNSGDTAWSSTCKGNSTSSVSCSENGNTVTCSSSLNPGVMMPILISGSSVAGYNGQWYTSASSSSSFSFYDQTTGLGSGSEATVTVGSEVPTADPNYPNPVPSSETLPASFYDGVVAAHPSCGTGLPFWKNPTTGTCPPYPPIGPDTSNGDIGMCTSGTYNWSRALTSAQCVNGSFTASTNGGFGNSNPAMRCYLNQMSGHPDGTGGFLAFNAANCYAADAATAGPTPPPPTGVSGSVTTVSQ